MGAAKILQLYTAFEESLGKDKARIIVDEISGMIEDARNNLTTKADLKETELKLTKEIEEVKLELTKEIEAVKLDIEKTRSSTIKWITGLLVVQTGVIVSIIALLLKMI